MRGLGSLNMVALVVVCYESHLELQNLRCLPYSDKGPVSLSRERSVQVLSLRDNGGLDETDKGIHDIESAISGGETSARRLLDKDSLPG